MLLLAAEARVLLRGSASGGRSSLDVLRGGAAAAPESEDAKALYALGCNVGRQMGDLSCLNEPELEWVLAGVKDMLLRVAPQVSLEEHMPAAAKLFKARQEAERIAAAEAGATALAAAAAEEGAESTDSGLVIKPITAGDGATPAGLSSVVRVHYEGSLVDGSVFDSSYRRGEPIEFPLSAVIKGWAEGLMRMSVGGKAKLTIPASLAYGEEGKSTIPPNSTLIFTVELLSVSEATAGAGAAAAGTPGVPEEEEEDDEDDDVLG